MKTRSDGHRVYVGRLPDEATGEDVRTFFRQFGKLKKINLHRGYGFVDFQYQDDSEEAIAKANDTEIIPDHKITVQRSTGYQKGKHPITRRPRNRIVVENLHPSVTWQTLKDKLRKFGSVVFTEVEGQEKSRNLIGHAEFSTAEEVEKVIKALNGEKYRGTKIYLKKVPPPDDLEIDEKSEDENVNTGEENEYSDDSDSDWYPN